MGTTALVAASVTAAAVPSGVAVADEMEEMMAEPISLSIGGRSHHGVAIVDNDAQANRDDVVISNDVQLTFIGSTTLDNGINVSMSVTLEGEEGDDQADASYLELEGSFGAIRVGNDGLASKKMATFAPYASFFYGIADAYWHGSFNHPTSDATTGVWTNTYADAGVGDSATLSYYSPRLNGFQFGVSYAPEAGTEARSGSVYSQEGNDAWGAGVNYFGSVGDAGVALSMGYASHDVPAVTAAAAVPAEPGDPGEAAVDAAPGQTVTEVGVGLAVSMSGFSIGSTYSSMDPDSADDDLVQYDFGLMYGEGPWAVSANYGNKNQDNKVDTDFMRLMGSYNIGPGIDVVGVVGSDSHDNGNETSFGAVALGVSF
jgi:hypothetical protein